ncbi:hypothetical protein MSG28_006038 [Choristoneura fumiferana]|uniref:Uncharacterized protein n=1 Tax=Choristoneura fumiferana TaxID=7141 RepID=A0ACC0JDE0_CHOFU|nr:hypothetical protein MSG28_006038 [Choristoneura fumiferana]
MTDSGPTLCSVLNPHAWFDPQRLHPEGESTRAEGRNTLRSARGQVGRRGRPGSAARRPCSPHYPVFLVGRNNLCWSIYIFPKRAKDAAVPAGRNAELAAPAAAPAASHPGADAFVSVALSTTFIISRSLALKTNRDSERLTTISLFTNHRPIGFEIKPIRVTMMPVRQFD